MSELAIRPLARHHVGELGQLARDIWHAHYPGIISPEQIDFMLAQRYSPAAILATLQQQHWAAAWLGSEMVGFVNSFADAAPAAWKLDKLYVHPARQRQGIGRALLASAIARAREAGAGRLVLRVNRHNRIALAAYANYGFKVYGKHVLDIGDGFVMDDFLLELTLCS